jgi:pyruvate dehydrogenase E2 component (dihydrolipoamide acetyltransferase)
MPVPVTIPKATISLKEATILRWLKAEGDSVSKDDPLFEMETDKAVMEVPAPDSGTVLRILIQGGLVKVEQVVAWIGRPGDPIEISSEVDTEPPGVRPNVKGPDVGRAEAVAGASVFATPAARRRGRELAIDLRTLAGSGPEGRIIQEDVERAGQSKSAALAQGSSQGQQNRRSLIQHLSVTWRTVPHIHIGRLLDAGGLMEAKTAVPPAVSITDLLLFLLARLLPEFPELTMTWSGEELRPACGIALSFAVDTQKGVVAPVIHNASSLSLAQLSQCRRRLAEAARAGRLSLRDLEGGVFTLTNLGMREVDFFAPILNAPQTAILASGRIAQQPIVAGGGITIGWRMWANLAVDHRVADGAAAARFLAEVQSEIHRLPQEARKP